MACIVVLGSTGVITSFDQSKQALCNVSSGGGSIQVCRLTCHKELQACSPSDGQRAIRALIAIKRDLFYSSWQNGGTTSHVRGRGRQNASREVYIRQEPERLRGHLGNAATAAGCSTEPQPIQGLITTGDCIASPCLAPALHHAGMQWNMLKLPLSGAGKQPAQHTLRARVRNQLPQWRKPRALHWQHFAASSPQRQRQVLPHLTFSALQIFPDTTQPGCQCHSTMQQRQAS